MKHLKNALALVLCAAMLLAFVPVIGGGAQVALAADEPDTPPAPPAADGVETSKTTTLQADGTYTIDLEAYVTGTVTSTTETVSAPLDIALVLDVSGSMDETITLGSMKNNIAILNDLDTGYGAKEGIYRCKASTKLAPDIDLNYDMRYSGGNWQYDKKLGGWTNISDVFNNYNFKGIYIDKIDALKIAADKFVDSVSADATKNSVDHQIAIVTYASSSSTAQGLTSAATGASTLKTKINALNASGATCADSGMQSAYSVLNGSARTDAIKVAVLFTDGSPTHGSANDDFSGDAEAKDTASGAIAWANIIKAEKGKSKTVNTGVSRSGHVSSASGTGLGGVVYSVIVTSGTPTSSQNQFLNYVSSNYPDATNYTTGGTKKADSFYLPAKSSVELESVFQTISKEILSMSADITLTNTAVVKDIIAEYFGLPEGYDASKVKVYTANCTGEDSGKLTFGSRTAFTDANINVDVDNKTITVTNFDFSDNWCGKDTENKYRGMKLIIEIPGIEVEADGATNAAIPTNGDGSGIYDGTGENAKEIQEFNKPEITVLSKAFIIDYAQPTTLALDEFTAVTKAVTDLANAKTATSAVVDGTYGKLNGKVYTPTSTKWNAADVFYLLGTTSDGGYSWMKTSILPANNIYFEDSFAASDNKGGVNIQYTGFAKEGSSVGNVGDVKADAQGWVTSLADDTGFTDGTAMKAESTGTAVINFTGTGIEVYTRTDTASGAVCAVLRDAEGTFKQYCYMDNKSLSDGQDGYYSVPTLSFMGLDYGTYSLTITVMMDSITTAENRTTYYIDGFRVYNPIDESEAPVKEYGDEANAQFLNIVDFDLTGSVYVDEYVDDSGDPASGMLPISDDMKDNMAKNEVYLAKGASVSFDVPAGYKYYIGMKSLTGAAVTATLTNGKIDSKTSVEVKNVADMYYEIVPTDGTITIANAGDAVLALTKIKATTPVASGCLTIEPVSGERAKLLATWFKSLPVEEAPEEAAEPEVVEAPETAETEPEVKIEIVRPAAVDTGKHAVLDLVKSIIGSFRKLLSL